MVCQVHISLQRKAMPSVVVALSHCWQVFVWGPNTAAASVRELRCVTVVEDVLHPVVACVCAGGAGVHGAAACYGVAVTEPEMYYQCIWSSSGSEPGVLVR